MISRWEENEGKIDGWTGWIRGDMTPGVISQEARAPLEAQRIGGETLFSHDRLGTGGPHLMLTNFSPRSSSTSTSSWWSMVVWQPTTMKVGDNNCEGRFANFWVWQFKSFVETLKYSQRKRGSAPWLIVGAKLICLQPYHSFHLFNGIAFPTIPTPFSHGFPTNTFWKRNFSPQEMWARRGQKSHCHLPTTLLHLQNMTSWLWKLVVPWLRRRLACLANSIRSNETVFFAFISPRKSKFATICAFSTWFVT